MSTGDAIAAFEFLTAALRRRARGQRLQATVYDGRRFVTLTVDPSDEIARLRVGVVAESDEGARRPMAVYTQVEVQE